MTRLTIRLSDLDFHDSSFESINNANDFFECVSNSIDAIIISRECEVFAQKMASVFQIDNNRPAQESTNAAQNFWNRLKESVAISNPHEQTKRNIKIFMDTVAELVVEPLHSAYNDNFSNLQYSEESSDYERYSINSSNHEAINDEPFRESEDDSDTEQNQFTPRWPSQ